jgi:hypothetical protein
MPPAGFETTIPASERLQTHTLDHTATGIGRYEFDKSYSTQPSALSVRSAFWSDSTIYFSLSNTFNGCGGALRVEHTLIAANLMPVYGGGGGRGVVAAVGAAAVSLARDLSLARV